MLLSLAEKTKQIQAWADAIPDGIYGHQTADAIMAKAGLASPPKDGMKVCCDAGHGLSNRKPGLYDPGCVFEAHTEADIAIIWAHELRRAFTAYEIPVFMTREGQVDSCPVQTRATRAEAQGCTHFISIHVNDADSAQANGTETLYHDDLAFATKLQKALLQGLGLNDRGVKQRPDLAVLKFKGQAALLELGFIKNATDRAVFTDPAAISATCRLIVEALR